MPTSVPDVFTLEAVNALVPRLNSVVGRQLARRADIEARLKRLCELTGQAPDDLAPRSDDEPSVVGLKEELARCVEVYQEGWQELEKLGAVLKDPRVGLLDFHGTVEGRRVWLCWKYGEEEVSHYHALDEGFSSRKPIDQAVKRRLLN
jgi:hypothetical protein